MPSLKMKIEDSESGLQSACTSSVEFDSVAYSQCDSSAMKFCTSTPTRTVSCDVSLNTNTDDVEMEMPSKISIVSTVSTASPFSFELNSSKDVSNSKVDNDIIEKLQIHNGRVWDRKYVAS